MFGLVDLLQVLHRSRSRIQVSPTVIIRVRLIIQAYEIEILFSAPASIAIGLPSPIPDWMERPEIAHDTSLTPNMDGSYRI